MYGDDYDYDSLMKRITDAPDRDEEMLKIELTDNSIRIEGVASIRRLLDLRKTIDNLIRDLSEKH